MRPEIEKGKITLDIISVVEMLDVQTKADLILYLGGDNEMIEAVTASLVDEWFFNDSGG